MVNDFLIRNIATPILHRVGSLAAAYLATQGVTAPELATIEGAITILGGLAIDFVIRKVV